MSQKESTIIVTAVGAVIGYGIVRCLRSSGQSVRIIGTDIFPDAVGQCWCDHFVQAVPAADPGYLDFVINLIEEHDAALVIPGTEYEIDALHAGRERFEPGARILLNRPEVIESMRDKWSAFQFFGEHGIPTIPSRIESDYHGAVAEFGTPMLFKLRRTAAGKGMALVQTEQEFTARFQEFGDNALVQKFVGSDEEEYTASVFGFGDGSAIVGPSLRRKLSKAGATDKAWTFDDSDLDLIDPAAN